ncbi:TonB-dependent receptor [Adhaeribacter soli]|uniref:TonB-dependent receptor plug domain-containing protein n=1 Tax=Adhaeribacter soli TaxID=2607655 RepID=A0A5N1J7R4_9BACT|nr:TonB-dependent receptor [Adhaeribacter soli]KAA9340850.1 TonB-dependent receptor plug domain-containing protein [Adhaeribacter soli]
MLPFFPAFRQSRIRFPKVIGSLLFLLLLSGIAQAQTAKFTINGFIRDSESGENLIGVSIYNPKTGQGTSTNNFGFYSITLPQDTVSLVITYVGYERMAYTTYLNRNLEQNFSLRNNSQLEAVEVIGERSEKIKESTRMSTVSVPIAQIKKLPALFGEVDVLKTLQLLPGVQSGGEGSSGLYVRGGSPDQNLILLDGAPVYNASHLFGFFSVFNADALNNVELIKGGFPARYGGRLSSVLDINMKEGHMNEYHGEGSVGIIAAKATVEGPIKKDVSSFIISARRTYIDVLMRPFMNIQTGVAGYYFYDLNGKVNYKFGQRDRLYLSAYTGYDKFYVRFKMSDEENNSRLGWGNLTTALRWNHIVNNRLFANTHFTYTKYQFDVGNEYNSTYPDQNGELKTDKFLLHYFSNIRDLSLKSDFDFTPTANHYIRFGGQYILHSFKPGALQVKDNFSDGANNIDKGTQVLGHEAAVYIEDDIKLTDRLKVNAGLRFNNFLVDKKVYPSLEPRLSARYLLTEDLALKASYAKTTQFIHLLTNSTIGLPTDLWVPATKKVKPQSAEQVALGLARTVFDDKFEVSLEGYYKKMNHLIEFNEGADFLGTTDNNWEDKVTSGQGWSYGMEFFIQKKLGKTTGWVGYTLAWATRKFPDLNNGEIYPYRYDRRHDVSIVVSHQLTEDIDVSGTWVYGTGNAVTLDEVQYYMGGSGPIGDSGSRNNFRMAPYHRIDFSLNQTKKKSWGEVVNSFGVYNAYNRKNPYFIYFDEGYSYGNGQRRPKFKQISLFPILPSFTKSFKF